MYDRRYEDIGLPVDPHLRIFLATTGKGKLLFTIFFYFFLVFTIFFFPTETHTIYNQYYIYVKLNKTHRIIFLYIFVFIRLLYIFQEMESRRRGETIDRWIVAAAATSKKRLIMGC